MTIQDTIARMSDNLQMLAHDQSCKDQISDIVASLLIALHDEVYARSQNTDNGGTSDERSVSVNVSFIDNQIERPYVCNIYPKDEAMQGYSATLCDHGSRSELKSIWTNFVEWNVDIDMSCIMKMIGDSLTNNMPVESVATMIVFDFLNVVMTDNVNDLIYDTYCETYMTNTQYERDTPAGVSVIFKLPIIKACLIKDWMIISCPIDTIGKAICTTVDGIGNIDSEMEAFSIGLATLVRMNSTPDAYKTPEEKHMIVAAEMEKAQRYAHNFVSRKRLLRDELLLKAKSTSSSNLAAIYCKLLDSLGATLSEKFTGYAVEGLIADHTEIFKDPDCMKKYDCEFSPLKHCCVNENQAMAMEGKFMTRLGELRRPPMLPSDREIDMVFVDIDKLQDQFGRKMVLNNIYDIVNKIDNFEEYYANDDSVLNRYKHIIDSMRERLDEARIEVLNKRSFKANYKVFISSPTGYEG